MANFKVFVHATDDNGRATTLTPWTYLSRLAKKEHYKMVTKTMMFRSKNLVVQVSFIFHLEFVYEVHVHVYL